ncbi:MAG: DnaJ domain-containing protein [Vicinamibacteria bacterium]|jgi:tetratricopeptide (TPR) repeat protein|nr:DnaJ domain-containing protein [Vicinamibacteria bacterium]
MSSTGPVPEINAVIAPGVLPDVLRQLYAERRSGDLVLLEGAHRTRFRVVRGHIVHAQSSDPKLHFGALLLESDQISRENFELASAIVRAGQARLGEALIMMGFLDAEQVEAGLAYHVRRVLQQALAWRLGHLAFVPKDADPSDPYDRPLPETTGEMVAAAARELPDEVVAWHLGDESRVLVPAQDPLVRFQRTSLTAIDGFVLSRVDGTLTAAEVVGATALSPTDVRRALFLLLCIGLVEFASEAPRMPRDSAQFLRQEIETLWADLRNRDHFAVLGVGREATAAEIKAAFYRQAKRYHPDVHHDPALVDLGAKLEDIFGRVVEAHKVLADSESRGRYRAALERLETAPAPIAGSGSSPGFQFRIVVKEGTPGSIVPPAPVDPAGMYNRALGRFDEGRYWEAIAILGELVPIAEGAERARARLLLARAHLKHPEAERDAERELLAVTREDPDQVEAFALLGNLYARRKMNARAATMLRRALELNPRHKAARADLADVELALSEGQRPK